VLGYYLTNKFAAVKMRKTGILLYLIGIIITIAGTFFLSHYYKRYTSYFYGYQTLNVLLAAVGIFFLFMHTEVRPKALILIRDLISKYSFGIYLVHVMVLDVFYLNGIYWDRFLTYPALAVPVISILCLSVSTGVIFLLNKIPYIGKYISG
jgi:surface polysaccharide O-acyltransferase-like enzyme